MKKILFVIATLVGVWYMFDYTTADVKDESLFVLVIPYLVTLLTMFVTRAFNIAFTWISSNFKVVLWSIPVFALFTLWVMLVYSVFMFVLVIAVVFSILLPHKVRYFLVRED
ncbi:TPA: hypothetical protein ACGO35_002158 [Streptococcus suis]